MIIRRYFTKELLQTTFSVTIVLVVVVMSGRFVKYLADAASGKLDPAVLFSIMLYRIPGFLELILPLSFMIAILMVYGRLYAEQEMTVLFSTGFSQMQILAYTFIPATFILVFVGLCSLWLTPLGVAEAAKVLEQQKQRSEFAILTPGKFQISRGGRAVNYFEELDEEQRLRNVFIARIGDASEASVVTIKATYAKQLRDDRNQPAYLSLMQGEQHQGRPGEPNYRVIEFQELRQKLQEFDLDIVPEQKTNAISTLELLNAGEPAARAALQRRFSVPLIVLVITIFGFTMSYTTPRRGRYIMIFPSILVYLIYLVTLNATQSAIEDRDLSPNFGLWFVHSCFLATVFLLFLARSGQFSAWFLAKKTLDK